MSVPDPSAFDVPPRAAVNRDAIGVRERRGRDAACDAYLATAHVDGNERRVRLTEPRLQGVQTRAGVDRIEAAAERWAAVDDHPLVASVVDWGVHDGVPWIASEPGDGTTLADRLAAAPIDPTEAVWLARNLCAAVDHVSAEVPHPVGLCPSRVLFRAADGDTWDLPRVTEVGFGPVLDDVVAACDGPAPAAVAPEQARPSALGEPDEAADVYRIGAILYELLTGRSPFDSGERPAVDAAPPAPTTVSPNLPAVADEVLLRGLAPDPDERYWTIAYLEGELADLADAVDG